MHLHAHAESLQYSLQYSQVRGPMGCMLFLQRSLGGKRKSTVDCIAKTWPVWGAWLKIWLFGKYLKIGHRCPMFGSVCSGMSGNGRTRVTVPSDTGMILSQIMMEAAHCMTPPPSTGLTEDVRPHIPSTAIMVSSFLFVKKGMDSLCLQRWIGNVYFGS